MMKKQFKVAAMSTLLLSSIAVLPVSFAKEPVVVNVQSNVKFTDVDKSHYAYEAIQWAQQRGIVSGYTDSNGKPNGKFGPNDSVTEAQFAKMLAEFFGFKDDKGKLNIYTSTPLWSDTYYDSLATYGVPLNGYFDSGLRNKSVKRGVVAQAIGHLSGNSNSLTDSINYLISEGITTGQNSQYENNDLFKYFGTNNTLTRAQAVAFLFRMHSIGVNKAEGVAVSVYNNKEGLSLATLANKGVSKLDSSLRLGNLGSQNNNSNNNNVVVYEDEFRKTITYGDIKVTHSGGSVGNNLKEIEELKKASGGKAVSGYDGIKYSEFTKEVRSTNENLVNNLDGTFDFVTGEATTWIYDKSTNSDVLVFTEDNYNNLNKHNYPKDILYYFDTCVDINMEYFKKSNTNKEKIHKLLINIGYDLSMKELNELFDKSIELKGTDVHRIRNYKAHTMLDDVTIMYVKK